MADDCVVSGTVFDGENELKPNAPLTVTPIAVTGVLVHSKAQKPRSDEDGEITFTVIQGAQYNIRGDVLGFTRTGVNVVIPNDPTADLLDLLSPSSIPSEGILIYDEGIPFADKVGSFNFTGSGINANVVGGVAVINIPGTLSSIFEALGDMAYADVDVDVARLPGNTTATPMFLSQTGTGVISAAPAWTALQASHMPSGIDALKIGGGAVSNTEFGHLDGVTSAIQTQINNRLTQAAADLLYQPLDLDLATIAALTPANDDIIQRKAGAWTNRTMAQLAGDLGVAPGGVDGDIQYNNAGAFGGSLLKQSANTIEQRNGANGQENHLFGNYVDGSNYRRIRFEADDANAIVVAEAAGSLAGDMQMYIGLQGGGQLNLRAGGTDYLSILSTGILSIANGSDLQVGTGTGTKIATAAGQKLGFWGAAPVAQQVLATGAGATVDNVISALQGIGLFKQS